MLIKYTVWRIKNKSHTPISSFYWRSTFKTIVWWAAFWPKAPLGPKRLVLGRVRQISLLIYKQLTSMTCCSTPVNQVMAMQKTTIINYLNDQLLFYERGAISCGKHTNLAPHQVTHEMNINWQEVICFWRKQRAAQPELDWYLNVLYTEWKEGRKPVRAQLNSEPCCFNYEHSNAPQSLSSFKVYIWLWMKVTHINSWMYLGLLLCVVELSKLAVDLIHFHTQRACNTFDLAVKEALFLFCIKD